MNEELGLDKFKNKVIRQEATGAKGVITINTDGGR